MTHRMRLAYIVLGLVWIGLGIATLIQDASIWAAIQVAIGIAWIFIAVFKADPPKVGSRQMKRKPSDEWGYFG